MLNNWVFIVAFIEMGFACFMYAWVLLRQRETFKTTGALRPLKRLLFTAVCFLMLGALPLMYVYANIVWFHNPHLWIVYFAVLSNASSKVAEALLLIAIYRFRIGIE